jgi:hypothetical protein
VLEGIVEQAESSRIAQAIARRRIVALMVLLLAIGISWLCWTLYDLRRFPPAQAGAPGTRVSVSLSPYVNTRPGVAFVGNDVCARCHAEISRAFAQHPMGRSMTTPEAVLSEARGLVFRVDDLDYSIDRCGGRVFHQETKHATAARAASKTEAEVRYVIGSGTRGYSFLIERGADLFQSPIAWYTQEQKWDLAPDYRQNNRHFDRVITSGCLFCHTNRFERQEGKPPVFEGLVIGCERCHGPGELHSRNPQLIDGKDLTIVNPVDLEPALRENVCEQCHFQGAERIDLPGHSIFDYRPGLNLEEYLRITSSQFDPTLRNRAVGHVEQMRESLCFKQSAGALGCTSCHDPHRLPSNSSRVAYYRDRCNRCHADHGCSLSEATRLKQNPQDDCTACHMPRKNLTIVAHTAMTNHAIPRHAIPAQPPSVAAANHGKL